MNGGIFYAVSVGSGDPLDVTLRAKQILESADTIVVPVRSAGAVSAAFSIAKQVADLQRKEILEVVFPMHTALNYRASLYEGALDTICRRLDVGKRVAMVTLGDVSVYSTATYVRQVLEEKTYQTRIVAGVPSFCAGAAAAGYSLCESGESFSVIPGVISPESMKRALQNVDNLVILKAGRILPWLLPFLESQGLLHCTIMLQNVGMPEEYIGAPRLEHASYFTTLLIKKGGLR